MSLDLRHLHQEADVAVRIGAATTVGANGQCEQLTVRRNGEPVDWSREFGIFVEEFAGAWIPDGKIALVRRRPTRAHQVLAIGREADAIDPVRVRRDGLRTD